MDWNNNLDVHKIWIYRFIGIWNCDDNHFHFWKVFANKRKPDLWKKKETGYKPLVRNECQIIFRGNKKITSKAYFAAPYHINWETQEDADDTFDGMIEEINEVITKQELEKKLKKDAENKEKKKKKKKKQRKKEE